MPAKKAKASTKTSRKSKKHSKSAPSSNTKSSSKIKHVLFNQYAYMVYSAFAILFISYVVYLDVQIREKMSGRIWSLPSHVYARPLELYQDKVLSIEDLSKELTHLNYHKTNTRPSQAGEYRILNGSHIELIARDFTFWDGKQKSQGVRLSIYNNKVGKIHELYSDKSISLLRLEPAKIAGIYPAKKEERQIIKLSEVPDDLVVALLAVEDRRFYQHWGLDPRAIARAFLANIMAGQTVQGGSTLTQQLVKNLFLSPDRTLVRKINEAIMSLLIEFHYDKAVILEAYINEVYLGQSGSKQIHGFELASQFYFAKHLKQLRRDQMALLVGLVKGPSWYEPRKHTDRAKERRNQVLQLMFEQEIISEVQLNKYSQLSLGLTNKPSFSKNRFPALVDLVKRQLQQDYNEDDLKSAGLRIFTSIDPIVQSKVEASVRRILPRLERDKNASSELQASVIVASSQQGEIKAMVSDRNPDFPGFNRSLDAVRQVGSLIKPAIYLSALQQPRKYTLATLLDDTPLHIKTAKDQTWSPQNYDKEFKGQVSLLQALNTSRNVPTVRLGLELGLADIADTLHNLGVVRDIPTYPSMTLGAFSLSPLDVANMYQTFAASGFHVPLKVIREVHNKDGKPLKRYPLESEKTLNEQSVYLVNHVLHEVTQTGTAKSLKRNIPHDLAGKTGTTDDLRDSWFAGFSDESLAVVWIGRDDNTNTGLTGSSGALSVWTNVMQQLDISSFSRQPPPGIENHWVDAQSGGLSEKYCQGAVELPFISGSAPIEKVECKSGGILNQLRRLFN